MRETVAEQLTESQGTMGGSGSSSVIGEIAHSDFDGGTFETGEIAESNAGGFGLMVSDSPPFGKVSLAFFGITSTGPGPWKL